MQAQRSGWTSEGREQRAKPRISLPFPAEVSGKDDRGEAFSVTTVLDNVSGDGLYLRLLSCVEPGSKLSIVLRLLTAPDLIEPSPGFAIEGVVVRAEEMAGGACGVAVTFDHVRFI